MIRNAFTMKLKPGCAEEYKKRHNEIWPERSKAHTDAGIFDLFR
jgi:L-rhamnose mutarotase